MSDLHFLQTYVRRSWFVSTAKRESSAIEGPREFYETLVWEWNPETRERGQLRWDLSETYAGGTEHGARQTHEMVVSKLLEAPDA